MADTDYVEGLTGQEIITDVLDQINTKLNGNCSLRDIDTYTGGYDGWVEYHLNLHGLDTITVKEKIHVESLGGARPVEDEDPVVVEDRIEIPNEERLDMVRERSGQGIPTPSFDEQGDQVVKKRHYARRPVVAGAA